MNKQKEDWKEIDGYNGYYEISNMGRVMSYYGKKKKVISPGGKYPKVTLSLNRIKQGYLISTLVWDYFGSKKRITHEHGVIHINGDITDNRINNLRVWTIRKITAKSYNGNNLSSKYRGVFYDKKRDKYIAAMSINGKRKYLGIFKTGLEAAIVYREKVSEMNKQKYLDKYTSENGDCTQENKE